MNSPRYLFALGFFAILGLFAGCGGGGGGDSFANNGGGIGGTGITSTGTIDSFGSIFVNGIEFETATATIVLDSTNGVESDLRLGMIVTVVGTVDDNGVVGTADSVEFDDEVQGPIAAISVNTDGTLKTLTVLGLSILADQLSTVFDDVTFNTLAINDVVEVSGFFDASLVLHATRIKKVEPFVAGVSEIEIKGFVTALSGTQFSLGTYTVDFAAADLSGISSGILSDGLSIEVKGTLFGTTITATRIEDENGPFEDDEDNVSLEGLITNFVDVGDFRVAGQPVNAINAQLEPVSLQLMDGLQVEVEGAIINGILVANEVEARGGEIKLAATVQSLSVTNSVGSVTLGFVAGSVDFSVDSDTELGDETDTFDPITWSNIRAGDYLELKAQLNGNQIIATEVRLKNPDDEIIQGPVESFVVGNEVTLLGISFITTGAEFEDSNDLPIDSAIFFTQLNQGDLVKVEDDFPADGVADEVELED